MKKRRFQNSLLIRILAYQLTLGIIPLLFLGLVSIFSISSVLKSEAIDFQEENVKQGSLYINLVMDNVESLVANLSGNDEINTAMSSDTSKSSYDKLTTQAKIGYILSGYTNLKGLVSIDIFSNDNTHYHYGETLNISNIDDKLVSSLYSEALKSNAFVNWNGIESNINLDSEYPTVITATKILYARGQSSNAENARGLLVVSYDPAVFKQELNNTADKDSFSLILDSKNRIVYHTNSNMIGQSLNDTLAEQMARSSSGSFTELVDQTNMLVVYEGTQKGGWTVAKFVPLSNILSNASFMTILLIGLIFFSIIVTGIFGFVMSRQIIQPIKKVTDTFRLLQTGDFSNVSKLNPVHQDEIGELANLFNSFIDAREDITTQKKLERQLNQQNQELQETLQALKITQTQMVQQEKMAGIGQLAAGVAHEINNPLGFVTSNFSVLKKYIGWIEKLLTTLNTERAEDKEPETLKRSVNKAWEDGSIDMMRDDLTEIMSDTSEGLVRIADIVNALKTFSRTSMLEERNAYDLNEGIRTTLLIANNEIKYSSTVQFTPSQLPLVNANGGQINQVLLNVLVNAAQAIKQKQLPEKGLISVKTYLEKEYICCEVQDDGCGMSEEVMKRIFEPFFTTKPVGKGTGLGLSLAYDIIVNKHEGKLEVSSEPGVGTCIRILIPLNLKMTRDETFV